MANQIMVIVNPTATEYTNVNAAGDDVPAYGWKLCTLTDAEQATFAAAHTSALMLLQPNTTFSAADQEVARLASKILRLGGNPSTRTDDTA